MAQTAPLVCADGEADQRIQMALQERIGPQEFNAWFRHGTKLHLEDGYAKVAVPNPFVANWVENHYRAELAAVVEQQIGQALPVLVTIDPALSGDLRQRQLDVQAEIVQRSTDGRTRPRRQRATPKLQYSLDDFVVGERNRLAYSAAVALARSQSVAFNPLFVHGPCGVGKTHLLQGICSAARRSRPERSWRYVTAEQFTNEYIRAIRHKGCGEFRERYRALDLLAIDDVHFLSAKKGIQEEFLHTFNAISGAGNQIVLASDAHPRLVADLHEQLVSRFVAGMVVRIDPPELETRREILRRRARALNARIPVEVLDYLAAHIAGAVRELEGALVKLAAVAALESRPVTVELAGQALADHLARTDSAVTLGDIETVVAAFFGITPADIHSSRRTRTVSLARSIAMFLARRHTRMSFPEIGRFMGKNHSSVVLAVQRIEKRLGQDEPGRWMTPAGEKSMPLARIIEVLTEQVT